MDAGLRLQMGFNFHPVAVILRLLQPHQLQHQSPRLLLQCLQHLPQHLFLRHRQGHQLLLQLLLHPLTALIKAGCSMHVLRAFALLDGVPLFTITTRERQPVRHQDEHAVGETRHLRQLQPPHPLRLFVLHQAELTGGPKSARIEPALTPTTAPQGIEK